jgi:hypothetical protein
MQFSDLALSRRLKRAEGHACAQFADARRRLFPDSGSEWMQFSGAYAVAVQAKSGGAHVPELAADKVTLLRIVMKNR